MKSRRSALVVVLYDAFAAALSLPLANYLRRGDAVFIGSDGLLLREALLFTAIAVPLFWFFGLQRGLWRYFSTADVLAIGRAGTLAILLFLPAGFLLERLSAVPRSVPVIQWLLLMALLGGPRLVVRLTADGLTRLDQGDSKPILLIGGGAESAAFVHALRAMRQAPFHIVGILTDHPGQLGRQLGATPILGRIGELKSVVEGLEARGERPAQLVLGERLDGSSLRRIVAEAEAAGLVVTRAPSPVQLRCALDEGSVELRPIALRELLGRPPVTLDRAAIGRAIAGRRILVTGAGGSIGSELVRQIARCRPARLVLLEASECNLYHIDQELAQKAPGIERQPVLCDVRDAARLDRVFEEERPETVFHAAALKHVPMVECNPREGVMTNVVGTRNVADAAWRRGVRTMVQISTDKAVNASSIMGATKRLAELYCLALDLAAAEQGAPGGHTKPRYVAVRFGNVLGSSGSVVPLFQRQLRDGGPLTVTHPEVCRYFMTINEAVELVLQTLAHSEAERLSRGEVFVLDMGEPIRITDLARQVIRLAGKVPGRDVAIEYTGLRPGEKLYEELFDAAEERRPAASGIFAARSPVINLALLRPALDELGQACARHDGEAILRLLARLVPGYRQDPHVREAA